MTLKGESLDGNTLIGLGFTHAKHYTDLYHLRSIGRINKQNGHKQGI